MGPGGIGGIVAEYGRFGDTGEVRGGGDVECGAAFQLLLLEVLELVMNEGGD